MQNLLKDLTELLSKDDRLVSEGKLLKNKVIELALKMDADLIKHLLKNASIKKYFFTEIDGLLVFDKIKFQKFVSNKEFLPDSYTAFKNKIGLINETGDYLSESKEVVLAWPYKDCVLEGGQTKEDQKRDEIFWNETLAPDEIDRLLAPKVLTNYKKYDATGLHELKGEEEVDFTKENLILKGNNLLALHSLYKPFARKVKMIYIDPPYNTGNDSFKYNDSFNRSTWLSFMKSRLQIAKDLLSHEGSIFVHLDYNAVHYCKVLMDDIFGRDNFINEIIWRRKQATSYGSNKFGITNDTILFYSKSDAYKFYPIYSSDDENTQDYIKERFVYDDGDGRKYMKSPLVNSLFRPNLKYKFKGINPPKNGWLYSKERMEEFYKNGELIIPDNPDARIYRKIFLDTYKGQVIQNIWTDIPIVNPMAKEQTAFSTQKPEKLLERIIQCSTVEGDLILDFHLGSGTTIATAHKMKRRYIGIEQMDYIESITVERLKKVIGKEKKQGAKLLSEIEYDQAGISKSANWQGGGSFVYCELMQYNEAYISRIQKAKTTKDLLTIWNEMQGKAFISYKVKLETINENISDFEKLTIGDQKRFLVEILDKNQLYVNYSEIDDKEYNVSDPDKKLNRNFYGAP